VIGTIDELIYFASIKQQYEIVVHHYIQRRSGEWPEQPENSGIFWVERNIVKSIPFLLWYGTHRPAWTMAHVQAKNLTRSIQILCSTERVPILCSTKRVLKISHGTWYGSNQPLGTRIPINAKFLVISDP
jgi:hypothetical protein